MEAAGLGVRLFLIKIRGVILLGFGIVRIRMDLKRFSKRRKFYNLTGRLNTICKKSLTKG